jgi:hypothetical protein
MVTVQMLTIARTTAMLISLMRTETGSVMYATRRQGVAAAVSPSVSSRAEHVNSDTWLGVRVSRKKNNLTT